MQIKNKTFRSLYDDVALRFDDVSMKKDSSNLFILMTNNFSYPLGKVIYNKDLKTLSSYLNDCIRELDKEYISRSKFESIISSEKIVTAFRGFWSDGENSYFYEAVIIVANEFN